MTQAESAESLNSCCLFEWSRFLLFVFTLCFLVVCHREMSKLATTVHPVNPGVLVLCPGEKDSWHRGRVSEIKGNKVSSNVGAGEAVF